MKIQERIVPSKEAILELRKLVAGGEGLTLEFKRKAAFPDKIVREIIAFANTSGGILAIGVEDDGSIPGVRYPEEEIHSIEASLKQLCRPPIGYTLRMIALSEKKYVVLFQIPVSDRRPHHLLAEGGKRESFVRVNDMTVKASRELKEIVRRSKQKKDVKFTYGPHESALFKYLAEHSNISLSQFCRMSRLNKFIASRKLITLVLANVLKVIPGQPDLYSRM